MDENPYRRSDSHDSGNAPGQAQRLISPLLKLLAILGIVGLGLALMLPAKRTAREAGRRNQCASNLHNIALALRQYSEHYHALPPACTVDADGKPLHSWRTLILPYIEGNDIYQSIDLSKPWDDPANAAARATVVRVYQCPSSTGERNDTNYLAIVGSNCCFRPSEPRSLAEISDDHAKTLMVIEVDSEHAVDWMSPIDADEELVLSIGPKSKLPHPGGMQAACVDGSVHFLDAEMPAAERRALISIAGSDGISLDEISPDAAD